LPAIDNVVIAKGFVKAALVTEALTTHEAIDLE